MSMASTHVSAAMRQRVPDAQARTTKALLLQEEYGEERRRSEILNLPDSLYSDEEDNAHTGFLQGFKLSDQDRSLSQGSSGGHRCLSNDSTSARPQEPKTRASASRSKEERQAFVWLHT